MKLTAAKMLSVVGKASCAAKVAGVALGLLVGAAFTGGVGLLIAGAYLPIAMAFCAN